MTNNLKVLHGLKSRKQQHNQKRMTYPAISYEFFYEAEQHKQIIPFQRQERWMTSNHQSQGNKHQPQKGIQYSIQVNKKGLLTLFITGFSGGCSTRAGGVFHFHPVTPLSFKSDH